MARTSRSFIWFGIDDANLFFGSFNRYWLPEKWALTYFVIRHATRKESCSFQIFISLNTLHSFDSTLLYYWCAVLRGSLNFHAMFHEWNPPPHCSHNPRASNLCLHTAIINKTLDEVDENSFLNNLCQSHNLLPSFADCWTNAHAFLQPIAAHY